MAEPSFNDPAKKPGPDTNIEPHFDASDTLPARHCNRAHDRDRVFCRFFVTHPHLFPSIPESWALWLVDAYGARNQEDVADLEGWTGLVLGFIATSLVTWLALKTWRHVKRPRPSD
ncbi:hypothetical protein ACKZDW_12640 [Ralstonia syzygii subsp. celebesensis]|uniref:hypothetical protein n=1 Tax=Ralstonia syzygii TaxID=28097 RepID=UPI00387E1545